MIDTAQLDKAFHWLSRGSHSGRIHWTALSPSRAGIAGGHVTSADALKRIAHAQDGWDFYLNLNPADGRYTKPSRRHIFCMENIGIDYDLRAGADSDAACAVLKMAADALCDGLSTAPYVIVDSGRGLWLWLPVSPISLSEHEDWEGWPHACTPSTAGRIIMGTIGFMNAKFPELHDHGHLDTSCAEVSRLVRCPGTVNSKNLRMAHFRLYEAPGGPGCGMPVRGLVDKVEEYVPDFPEAPVPPQPPALSEFTLATLAPHMNVTTRQFCMLGSDSSLESRHRRLFSAATNLKELGVPADTAVSMLFQGCTLCRPRNLLLDDPTALDRIMRQVWGKA